MIPLKLAHLLPTNNMLAANAASSKQQAVKVLVRIRPPNSPDSAIATIINAKKITIPKPFHDNGTKSYSFDRVLGPEATQAAVFSPVEVLLKDVFEGIHILATDILISTLIVYDAGDLLVRKKCYG